MNVVGYLDRLSVPAGGRVTAMVSTTAPTVDVDLVRLIHGDTNPAGPGFKLEEVAGFPAQTVPGRRQEIFVGSCMVAGSIPLVEATASLLITAWVQPTTPSLGRIQGIVALCAPGGAAALTVGLSEAGHLAVYAAGEEQSVLDVGAALHVNRWYEITLTAGGERLELAYRPLAPLPHESAESAVTTGRGITLPPVADVVIAAGGCARESEQWRPVAVFNGKIEHPRLSTVDAAGNTASTVADWRFEVQMEGSTAVDVSGHDNHGTLVNSPLRATTGRKWTGRVLSAREAPEEYGAIWFHEDDLDDAGWTPDLTLDLPGDLPSGVYAVRLRIPGETDYVPVAVTPAPDRSRPRTVVLLPTFTYLAYANERLLHRLDYEKEGITDHPITPWLHDVELAEHPEYGLSLYDTHTDGAGSAYSSYLRPILNLRPDYRMWLQNAPRHLSADLYLIDWLEERDEGYDVITDHDLHAAGAHALDPYDVVITGSHPEYYSERMLDGLQAHLESGGSLMYLGGNGFYWVTSQAEDRPHLLEVRRGHAGTRTWEVAPGDAYHSTTGEPGGLWRHRGRSPNAMVGVGMCSQGWDEKAPGYSRLPDSFAPQAEFVFRGVGADEIIGDFGLIMNGSSGDELDRFDPQYGSPPQTLVLARSTGHSDFYQLAGEDVLMTRPGLGGSVCELVRSDMVLVEQAAGGAVFSVGSICFTGALSHNNYRNNVSTIVGNVLQNFLSRPGKTALHH